MKINAVPEFTVVSYPEPHKDRGRKILQAHPEVKALFGPDVRSLGLIIGIVAFQIGIAFLLRESPWWVIGLAAYCIGAFAHHAMFVLIHEATHNLILKTTLGNRFAALLANVPLGLPMAMAFRSFHLIHHRYQGDPKWDADLATPWEQRWVGNNTFMKILWLLGFMLVEGFVRPLYVTSVKVFDKWSVLNLAIEIAFCVGMVFAFGWPALAYLWLSTFFSVGLHPLGARWIQEHYVFKKGQETYSYYGPLNIPSLNVGYHNEHHDMMLVSWSRLPKLKAMAPEFYDHLHAHTSWTKLVLKFIFDPTVGMSSRVTRSSEANARPQVRPETLSRAERQVEPQFEM